MKTWVMLVFLAASGQALAGTCHKNQTPIRVAPKCNPCNKIKLQKTSACKCKKVVKAKKIDMI